MTTPGMTVTVRMRENAHRIGQKVFRDYKGSLKGSVTAAINAVLDDLAMRALEPGPVRSDEARVEAAKALLNGWRIVVGEWCNVPAAVVAAIDAHDPLRHVSSDGIEAALREWFPGGTEEDTPTVRQQWRDLMSRAIAAFLAAEGRNAIKDAGQAHMPGVERAAVTTGTKHGTWNARDGWTWTSMADSHADHHIAPDVWEPPEQCETPAACRHQRMCEKFMAGKCGASAEPSERVVLGALARFTLHIRGDAVKVLPEDNATLHRAAEWKL